jgi:hypothetical protein
MKTSASPNGIKLMDPSQDALMSPPEEMMPCSSSGEVSDPPVVVK